MITIEELTSAITCATCDSAMEIIRKMVKLHKKYVNVIAADVGRHPEKSVAFGVMRTLAVILKWKLAFEGPLKEVGPEAAIQEALA